MKNVKFTRKEYLTKWFNQGFEIVIAPCSNACGHCYSNATIGGDNCISLENYEVFLKFFAGIRDKYDIQIEEESIYLYIYQELLLHPQWSEILKLSKKYGFISMDQYLLTTNGSAIAQNVDNQEFVDKFREFSPECTQLVIHGKQEAHDKFSARKGSYSDIVKVAEFLKKENMPISWQYFFTKDNIDDFPEISDLMQKLTGSETIQLRLMIANYGGRMIKNDLSRPTIEDFNRLPDKYLEIINESRLFKRVYTEKEYLDKFDLNDIIDPGFIEAPIIHPDLSLYTDWDYKRRIGNLSDKDAEEKILYLHNKVSELNQRLQDLDIKNLFEKYSDVKDTRLSGKNSIVNRVMGRIIKGEGLNKYD